MLEGFVTIEIEGPAERDDRPGRLLERTTREVSRVARTSTPASTGPSDENEPADPVTAPSAEPETSAPIVDVEPSRGERTPEGPQGRRRFRRRLLLMLVGLLAIVALLAVELPQYLSPKPSPTPAHKYASTIWQTITDGITNGTVPTKTALEAFSYVYRVSIPGVTVPGGIEGGDGPISGTGVMSWVQANWSALTPDQQAVINRYLAPATQAGTSKMTPAATDSTTGSLAKPRFQLDKVNYGWPIITDVASDAPNDLALAMAKEILADVARIGPKLNLPTLTRGSLALPNIELTVSDQSGGDALLLTQGVSFLGTWEPCFITAYKEAWGNESVTASGGVSDRLHVLITHEVVHCYQNTIWGSQAVGDQIPSWIKEGTAMYLAADDTGIAEPILGAVWTKGYFGRDETDLTDRTYDSFGYYALLAHEGKNLWSTMAPAWQAAAKGPERSAAFIAALGGEDPVIVNNWAESYLRRNDWGDPWIAYGFGLPDSTQVVQHPAQAEPSPGWIGSVNSLANTVLNVNATSGEVVTIATDGLASVHDENGSSATAFTTKSFCTTDGGCTCPQGSLLAGQNMAQQQLSIPFVAAFNGAVGGSKYSIISDTLDHLCKTQHTPTPQWTPNYGPCGAHCSQSNGDPHMLTVNQYRYDMQAAGEFTLLTSPDGSVDIQARQEPFGTSGQVAINTAVAAKVGSHRVGVYMTASGLVAHVDGAAVDLTAGPQDLGNGGRIAAVDKGYEIDFPDGTQMWALAVSPWGINAQIKTSASLGADATGVLGPVVPGGLGIPALPDGTRLPAATSLPDRRQTINGQFADAWRLTDANSLFDYDPGKSTATYTKKPYPTDPKYGSTVDLSSDQLGAGNAACSSITDQGLHDDCVFDVGVTGETGFAQGYTRIQGFYDLGVVAASPTPVVIPSSSPAPGLVSGAFTVTQGTRIGGYVLGPDNTTYLTAQATDGTNTLISFDPVAGKLVKQVSVPALTTLHYAAGSVWLPGLKTDSNGRTCSITRFDAGTLLEQATIAVPCDPFDTAGTTASDGDAIWFEDSSKYDSTTLKGNVMTRIDPQTNQLGTSVPLSAIGGYTRDSQGAFFYFDGQKNGFRLTTGSTAFDSFGSLSAYFSMVPGGTGLWAQDSTGKTAVYFTQGGTPTVTLPVGGALVAGDANAAYEEVEGVNSSGAFETQLWRYPIDGSTATQINSAPTIDGEPLGYSPDPQPIANGNGVLKLWSTRNANQQLSEILLQWTPAP